MVGLRRDELIDEVTLGAHDLDPVVASPLREHRAAGVGGDGSAHAPTGERARTKRRDRRLERRGRDGQRVIRIAAGVQDLHPDLAAGRVHGVGDDAMLGHLPRKR